MAKVPEKKVVPHTRHEYLELSCVSQGFYKAKNGILDNSKMYTTLYCRVCGQPKEIVAASNMLVNIATPDLFPESTKLTTETAEVEGEQEDI